MPTYAVNFSINRFHMQSNTQKPVAMMQMTTAFYDFLFAENFFHSYLAVKHQHHTKYMYLLLAFIGTNIRNRKQNCFCLFFYFHFNRFSSIFQCVNDNIELSEARNGFRMTYKCQ